MAEAKEQKQLTLKEQNEERQKRTKYLKYLKEENELMEQQLRYYQFQVELPKWYDRWQKMLAQQAVAEEATQDTGKEEVPIIEMKNEDGAKVES